MVYTKPLTIQADGILTDLSNRDRSLRPAAEQVPNIGMA